MAVEFVLCAKSVGGRDYENYYHMLFEAEDSPCISTQIRPTQVNPPAELRRLGFALDHPLVTGIADVEAFDTAAVGAEIGQERLCAKKEPAVFILQSDPAGFGAQPYAHAYGQHRALAVGTGLFREIRNHNGPFEG